MSDIFTRHRTSLVAAGSARAIYAVTGRIDLPRLCRAFHMHLQRKHPNIEQHHFFWFQTEEGMTVSYAGPMSLIEAVEQFMSKAIPLGIVGDAVQLYSGYSKDVFETYLEECLSHYSPLPHARSYGGTHTGASV